jgi:hypothetical protein
MAKARQNTARRLRTVTISVTATAVGIDSNFEPITASACAYRNSTVYPYLSAKGFNIVKLQGALARRMYVAPAVKQTGVEYITGVGHGAYDTYTGNAYEPIFQVGHYDPAEPKGKIVHLLSCETGRDLGPDFVKNGCLAYFGYDENFSFVPDDSALFFACDSEIDLGFADGQAAEDVYARTMKKFNDQIASLKAAGKLYSASLMQFNRDHLRSPHDDPRWGQKTAKLAP